MSYEPTEEERERLEELKDRYEGNSYSNGEYTFTVTEIGICRYGHMAEEKGNFYSTIEYEDGYVCHPSIDALENQIQSYEDEE